MYKTKIPGLSSGFRQLDEVTIGWHPSELVIIAARPAMGKTAFGISMAKRMAMDLHIPIAVFSLEMSNTQYVHRYMSVAMGVPLNTKDEKQIMSALHKFDGRLSQIAEAPLYLDDTPSLTIAELRAKAGQLIKEHGVKMLLIDYMQLMSPSEGSYSSRAEEMSDLISKLKDLSKELNVPIIALSQLNRSLGTSEDKHPQLSDLRELSDNTIKQYVDKVCFIHRPEYYNLGRANEKGLTEFIIYDCKTDAVKTMNLRFRHESASFEE